MDDRARGWRLVLRTLLAAAAIAACGGGEALGPVGTSLPHAEPPDRARDAGDTVASPVPTDFRSRMVRVSGQFLSRGHGEKYDATVWTEPDADAGPGARAGAAAGEGADAAASVVASATDPSVYVEDLVIRDPRGDRFGGLLVMRRQGATWHFAAVGSDGLVAPEERTRSCEACHRDAPHGVFPWGTGRP